MKNIHIAVKGFVSAGNFLISIHATARHLCANHWGSSTFMVSPALVSHLGQSIIQQSRLNKYTTNSRSYGQTGGAVEY